MRGVRWGFNPHFKVAMVWNIMNHILKNVLVTSVDKDQTRDAKILRQATVVIGWTMAFDQVSFSSLFELCSSTYTAQEMRFNVVFALALVSLSEAQLFKGLANLFRNPFGGGGGGGFNLFGGGGGRFHDDGTQRPVATGRDETFPSDCGRNTKTGRGNLCFPDAKLCQQSKYNFVTKTMTGG